MVEACHLPEACPCAAALSVRTARPWLACGLLLAAALSSSCADQQKVRETELTELLVLLAGHYDNTEQVQADAHRALHPPHDPLSLAIVPVDDPVIGDHVFYVQEMAADDPRRVMVQRVWTFGTENKAIVQSVWTLKEPLRWRDGHENPDVLKGLMNQDVVPVRGCNLIWKKSGAGFTAVNDAKTCRSTSRATGGTVQIDTRMELDANGLGLAENATDASGQLVEGRTDEPFVRFRKR
jgi:hypothetical protein